jgi:hypothetical protein
MNYNYIVFLVEGKIRRFLMCFTRYFQLEGARIIFFVTRALQC